MYALSLAPLAFLASRIGALIAEVVARLKILEEKNFLKK